MSPTLLDLTPSAGVYERRAVGLFAVDVRDSTLLHQSIGNRKAHAWTAAVLDLAETTARDFDGTVVKTVGDTVMATFPGTAAAVKAGLEIQSRLGDVRAASPADPAAALRLRQVARDAISAVPPRE